MEVLHYFVAKNKLKLFIGRMVSGEIVSEVLKKISCRRENQKKYRSNRYIYYILTIHWNQEYRNMEEVERPSVEHLKNIVVNVVG